MAGKRPLSKKAALKMFRRRALSPQECRELLYSIYEECPSAKNNRTKPGAFSFAQLELDKFHVISNWYHFAILSLASLKKNRFEPRWISNQLGISVQEADDALSRLLRLGLIKKRGRGFFQTSQPLWVATDQSSRAIRKYHGENLERAKAALDDERAKLELFSSVTMVVDEKKLEGARAKIKKFRDGLTKYLASGNEGERVFTLSIQLFPISKGDDQ